MDIIFPDMDNKISTVAYQFTVDNHEFGRLIFRGNYRHGSQGNSDGDFMAKITDKVLNHKNIKSLLVDIKDLEYTWGNTIMNVTTLLSNAKIPIAVLYSDKCKDIPIIDANYFFKTENEALIKLNQSQLP